MNNSRTKVVMLGSGTPNTDPDRSGPSVAVIVDEMAYIVDCGAGVVRKATKAYHKGITALKSEKLSRVFITHLHSDHTLGLADLILSPWVMERQVPIKAIGPTGLKDMVNHILLAYKEDINERLNGFEEANKEGIKVEVNEIACGVVYKDEYVEVEALPVIHGSFRTSLAYKFYTPDKTIVISGDTYPCEALVEASKDVDILIHESYHTEGLKKRELHWQKYHSSVHTSALELGIIADKAKPKLLVMYHHLFMFDINTYTNDLYDKIEIAKNEMIADVKKNFSGNIAFAEDLDIY